MTLNLYDSNNGGFNSGKRKQKNRNRQDTQDLNKDLEHSDLIDTYTH